MRAGVTLAAALFLSALTAGAQAGVTLFTSPGGIQPDENVLMIGQNADPTKVDAETNQTNSGILFTSDENIFPPASGQARVEAEDGSYRTICIEIAPQLGFLELEFNVNVLRQSGNGQMLIEVFGAGDLSPAPFLVDLDENGENYFGLQATGGAMMTKVCLTIEAGDSTEIMDTRQWRIGGVGPLVPEASTFAMFGVGLVPFAAMLIKRRRR
jgi:hypothetical protein